jgi:acyl transferase domain-containing protein
MEASAGARVSRRVSQRPEPVAIIGMAGRFPGAADIDAFWTLLREGTEAIAVFADDEMRESGMPEQLLRDPNYVGARGYLDGADMFDSAYFGNSARDAEQLDPQHRVLLECAVETRERAGYDADR